MMVRSTNLWPIISVVLTIIGIRKRYHRACQRNFLIPADDVAFFSSLGFSSAGSHFFTPFLAAPTHPATDRRGQKGTHLISSERMELPPPPPEYRIVDIYQWSGCRRRNGERTDVNADVIGGRPSSSRRPPPLPLVDLRSRDDYDGMRLAHPSSTTTAHHLHDADGGEGGAVEVTCDDDENDDTTMTRCGNADDDDAPVIVNLPLSSLISGERSCELPPRHLEFALLIPRKFARGFLLLHDNDDEKEGEGGCPIRKLFFSSRSVSTGQSRKPWLVRQVLIDDDELWKGASNAGCIFRGEGGGGDGIVNDGIHFRRLPRLWKPDPLMSSDVLPLLKERTTKACDSHPIEGMKDERSINGHVMNAEIDSDQAGPYESLGLVWDLGCGAGRDICYLAEEMKEFLHSLP